MIFESIHLRNEACPRCASKGKDRHRDNLGVFSDGHKFCWSCGYYESSTGHLIRALHHSTDEVSTPVAALDFPDDVEPGIRFDAHFWLSTYGITNADIYNHKIMWSEKKELLIFPIFDEFSNLLGWQGRSFSKESKGKYFTKGNFKNIIHLINEKDKDKFGIVVVEDIVSAIKVGHYACTHPIFGSHVNLERLERLKHITDRLIFWLDYDKLDYSYKFARRAELIGFKVDVISTHLDPKAQIGSEIEFKLENCK